MRTIIASLSIAALLSACTNNNTQQQSSEQPQTSDSISKATEPVHADATQTTSIDEVVSSYISLKNALTGDNGKDAATAGKRLHDALAKTDEAALTTEQKKVYDDVKEDITEHAEHIGENGGNIGHQREHFDRLSQDMIDLVKVVKPASSLYIDHCPMYNNKKGADWLSETREIKNPYYGSKMPTCGELKEEIKQ
jgi:hypothetical protein